MSEKILALDITNKCPKCSCGELKVNFDGIIWAETHPRGYWVVSNVKPHDDAYHIKCLGCEYRFTVKR